MIINNNKGFSLLEVIVTVAITSIVVTLGFSILVNSSRMYNRETTVIDMQTEVQIITSNLNEAFMEATKLEIAKDDATGNYIIDLGNYNSTDFSSSDKNQSCRRIYYNKDKGFLGMIVNSEFLDYNFADLTSCLNQADGNALREKLEGYMLSHFVSDFSVTVAPESDKNADMKDADGNITSIPVFLNPVTLNIAYTITNKNGVSDDVTLTVTLRNYLDSATVFGDTRVTIDKLSTGSTP